MTIATIRREIDMDHLPPTVDLPTAAAILGIGRTVAYELVRAGDWPTKVLRLGRQIRIPSALLRELVGLPSQPTPLSEVAP